MVRARVRVPSWPSGSPASIARAVGLTVPELVFIGVDPGLGDAEPDEELQDLVHRSGGLNLGLDFLPGALMFNPGADPDVDPEMAAEIVWLDAFVTNPDRSAVNPNLLIWHGRTWLIDHGAALYVHHAWRDPDAHAEGAFERSCATTSCCHSPGTWPVLTNVSPRGLDAPCSRSSSAPSPPVAPRRRGHRRRRAQRRAYVRYLERRLTSRHRFVEEAERARRAA